MTKPRSVLKQELVDLGVNKLSINKDLKYTCFFAPLHYPKSLQIINSFEHSIIASIIHQKFVGDFNIIGDRDNISMTQTMI